MTGYLTVDADKITCVSSLNDNYRVLDGAYTPPASLEWQSHYRCLRDRQSLGFHRSLARDPHPGFDALDAVGLAQVYGRNILVVVGGQFLLGQVAAFQCLLLLLLPALRLSVVQVQHMWHSMEVVCLAAGSRMPRHVDDAIVRVLVVDVPHAVVGIVAVATIALVRIRIDVDIATTAAAIVMPLSMSPIGSVAVSTVRMVRLAS